MTGLAKVGATAFILWGLLHLFGGGAILASTMQGPDAGFAFYRTAAEGYDALSGAILSYFAFGVFCLGGTAMAIGLRGNWRNSDRALAANTALVALTEIGLIIFLLIPGHLGLTDALPGLGLAALGIVLGGVACQRAETADANG